MLFLGLAASPAASASSHDEGHLRGDSHAWVGDIRWEQREVTTGITLRTGVLSNPSSRPFWTVTIDATAVSSITGQPAKATLGSAEWASRVVNKLGAAGFPAHADTISWPRYTDTPSGPEGVRVRTGDYPSQAAAQQAATTLQGFGFATATVEWTGYDHDTVVDGEQIHEAIIDPSRYAERWWSPTMVRSHNVKRRPLSLLPRMPAWP